MRKWLREQLMRRRRKKSPDTEQTGKIGQERPAGAAPLVPSYDLEAPSAKPAGRGKIEVETQPESLASPPHAQAIPEPPKPVEKRAPRGVVVLTIGLPGSGKSTWYKRRGITPLSSDLLRTILFDNITEQRYQHLVFSTLRSLLRARLIAKMPWNYVDATNLSPHERKQWIKMAKGFGYEVQAVFFDVPVEVCMDRNRRRERVVPDEVMQRMASKLKPPTFNEGFSKIVVVRVKSTPGQPEA
ncbi:MAG TPA: ATP-binding protein [Terriglobales bacterium]|nr:ATP-binding protein [Terriglobales bacterium]